MPPSGMLRRAALVRNDVSEESIASIIHELRSVLRLLVNANIVPSSQILVTLIMEEIRSSESSVLTKATLRNIPEGGIIHGHRCGNLNSYTYITS
jgi:hypothetical protein